MKWWTPMAGVGLALIAVAIGRAEPEAASRPSTVPTTAATEPATAPVSAEVSSLIDQLDADDFRTRQKAEDKLVALGESVRPAISPLATSGRSQEQRSRASGILARLDQTLANHPTMISLHVKDARPAEVFENISKQAGIGLPPEPSSLWVAHHFARQIPKITADFDNKPFWLAMADVCKQAGVTVRDTTDATGEHMAIVQNFGEEMLGEINCVSGPLIVMPTSAERNRRISYSANGQTNNSEYILFRVLVDPKIKIGHVNYTRLIEATDDQGQSIIPNNPASNGYAIQPSGFNFNMPLNLQNDGYTKAKILRGEIGLELVKRSEKVEIPNIDSVDHFSHDAGPYTVKIDSCAVKPLRVSIKLLVQSQTADMSNNLYESLRSIHLEDSTGKRLLIGNSSGGGGANVPYTFEADYNSEVAITAPIKLKWDVPAKVVMQSVPFEFKDLPLPTP